MTFVCRVDSIVHANIYQYIGKIILTDEAHIIYP